MSAGRLPTYFISHGGGPWPYMTGEFRRHFDKLEQSLIEMRAELRDLPRSVLVISGHWEDDGFAISSGERPGMVYDYGGFPEYLYHIRYAAPGSPELARRVCELLGAAGIGARLDPARGFDHGTFSIMKPLYPDEDIPVVQLSLNVGLDPALHIAVGRALAPLRDEGVLIIGSGLSFHNLSRMSTEASRESSRQFDDWLQQTVIHAAPDARVARLLDWEQAPAARRAHPREDHLIPLMVAVGAAEAEPAALSYHQADFAGGITASSFRFGPLPAAPSQGE
ncbi:DODA-type extradiol aromatic ring-opening family dioxygenase [Nitrospirillum pindoramense]|uniref:DODA-type extradiol aromatic ring-opening family dioxygenase n=1 Tax=Nitrospirillum amazonense TaxID=28077 RepID=UPI0011A8946C|nr:class III extradiol ring-cleavage dioxygenase [Nitrospirillum amazonense]